MKDETSNRVCQTSGQLGTNAPNGVASTARARPPRRSRRENGVEGELPEQHAVAGEERSVVEEDTATLAAK
uniref:Uncharacterized protein n=1 Tax=Oryza barthii TaxID=65489 RepID=A0A0D3GGV5_9ORYZ